MGNTLKRRLIFVVWTSLLLLLFEVVVEEGMFAIKPLMTATLSADHRVVDGAIAARFLQDVKKLLENVEA